MRVEKIALTGFRNYEFETVEFGSGVNVITGDNAQGKTNLLESVYLLSCGKSFRTRFDREMINFDYSAATVLADIVSHDRPQTISIELKNGAAKKILVNGVKKTATELFGTLDTVLFSPDELGLVKDGAAVRRKFLDNAISQLKPAYSDLLSEFNRAYDQKTRILKDYKEKPSLLDTLDEFSDVLCRCSAKIIRYRAAYIQRLSKESGKIHGEFAAGEELTTEYRTVSTVTDALATEKEIYYEVLSHFEAHRNAELESEQCLTGAHKDDLEICINGRPARMYASQGQTRTAALSLKLAEREILLQETGEYPVLLLDDVLSELDSKRQEFVLNRIGGGQTLISCCEDEGIAGRTGGKVLFVSGGRIR